MNTALAKVTNSINSMNSNLISKRLDNMETGMTREISAAAKKVEAAHEPIASQSRAELEEMNIELAELRKWCKKLLSESTSVQSQVNNMEPYSRRDNIIIHGVKEPAGETSVLCEKAVRQFFADQLKFSAADVAATCFVRCHRLHDRRATHKPIIVRFVNFCDRKHVRAKKTSITEKFVRIEEDFPKQIAYYRRKLFPVYAKARRTMDKKVVSLKGDNLIINGKQYTVDTLDQLSGELSMETFCQRSNDKVLVVGGIFSNYHPLSNYYKSTFVFRNQKYSSIEHGYRHVKAVFFRDESAAAHILASDDPSILLKD